MDIYFASFEFSLHNIVTCNEHERKKMSIEENESFQSWSFMGSYVSPLLRYFRLLSTRIVIELFRIFSNVGIK